jgi:hypothetical protein
LLSQGKKKGKQVPKPFAKGFFDGSLQTPRKKEFSTKATDKGIFTSDTIHHQLPKALYSAVIVPANNQGICTSAAILRQFPDQFSVAVKEMLGRYKVAAVPWSIYNGNDTCPNIQNNCAYDSHLFVLYFLQRNNIMQTNLPGYNLPDSKINVIFDLLDQDQANEARRLLMYYTLEYTEDNEGMLQLCQPGMYDAWCGVSDMLPILLHGGKHSVEEMIACSLHCKPQTEAEPTIRNSLMKVYEDKKQRRKTSKMDAKHVLINKKNLVHLTKGFGFVPRMETRRQGHICQKYIRKGGSTVRYHKPNRGVGKTIHFHGTISCLKRMDKELQEEFMTKKWCEQLVHKLVEGLTKKMNEKIARSDSSDTDSDIK